METQDANVLEAANKLLPQLRARADESESLRQVPQDLAETLAAAGLYRMWLPTTLGGLETPLLTSLRTLEVIATADASVSWCIAIGITSSLALPALPEKSALAILASPGTIMAGVYAPTGRAQRDGAGFRVNGQWAFGSGSRNASWILAGCRFFDGDEPMISKDGTPQTHMVVVPAADVELLDTWHVSGLRGTGSTDFRLSDVWVPESRISGFIPWTPPHAPLYGIPQLTLLAIGFGAISLGLARSALDEFRTLAASKKNVGSSRLLAESREAQAQVALAEAKLRSARSFYYESATSLWDAAKQRTPGVTIDQRADMRLATCNAVDASADAIAMIYRLGGGSAIYATSKLQRCFRDIHVITQHVQVRRELYAVIGSHLLGAPRGIETL